MTSRNRRSHRRRIIGAGVGVSAVAIALVACDTGDGTTLQEPTTSTTLPPPDTTPLSTLPLGSTTVPFAFDTLPTETLAEPSPETITIAPSAPPDVRADFTFIAPWDAGETIPIRNTCDGIDAAPELSFSAVPAGTQELALSFVDESDVSAGRPFIHWVMTGIDPTLTGIAENEVPAGAIQALNFFGDVGYTGPCPNPGTTSTFTLTLHALGQQLETVDATPAAQVLDLVNSVSIDTSSLSGNVTR